VLTVTLPDVLPTSSAGEPSHPDPIDVVARAGARLGHYVLLHAIGQGGMGVVYLAHDPRLDRMVALKILRGAGELEAGGSVRARLLREARSLARLAHPNVVRVFDVGEASGCAFVAMEYVRGETLSAWLRAKKRELRAIIDVFIDAGRGIAAAHKLGIVHRDFKPENVLVGTDGRARVLDFGIARLGEKTPGTSDGSPELAADLHEVSADDLQITRAGTVLGTPAYMAPEQHRGEAPTPAADQYSFCVALFEALFGHRPFAADSPGALLRRKLAMRFDIPAQTTVPRWLQRIVVRGLAADPKARWASIDDVVLRLSRGGKVRVPWLLAGGAAAIVTTAIMLPGREVPSCSGAARVAEVWSPARTQTIARAFAASELPYAADTWSRASAGLDRFAEQWTREHDDACVAMRTAEPAQAAAVDDRMQCLDARLEHMSAVLDLLDEVDTATVSRTVTTVAELTPPTVCREPTAIGRLPASGERRERAIEIRRRVTRAIALEGAGRFDEAVDAAKAVLADARELDHPPLVSEARYAYGSALERAGDYATAREELREALWQALAAGDDNVVARAGIDLVWLEGLADPHPELADQWSRHAAAALARSPDPSLEAQLANAVGAVHSAAGRTSEALTEFERALATFEMLARGGQDPNVATALQNTGITLSEEGRLDEAHDRLTRALAMFEISEGPSHPDVGDVLDALGGVVLRQGNFETARRQFERALVIRRGALGSEHPTVARSHNSLGSLYEAQGEWDAAQAAYRDAVAIFEGALGEHALVGATLANLGSALERGDRADEAAQVLERAIDMLGRTAPADHPWIAHAQASLGRAELRRGRFEIAKAVFDRARAQCGSDLGLCGAIDVGLARVAAHTGEDPRSLVTSARAALVQAGPSATRELAELDAFASTLDD
jgi:tetratricopeptide (TPR) repeat protein/predicted Ser/Thr protein kinase